MKSQEVIVRALSGAITWLQAADILGLEPRSVRRWRAGYEAGRELALYDQRTQRPSRRKAPALEVQRPAPLSRALRRLEPPPLLSLRLSGPRRDPLLPLRPVCSPRSRPRAQGGRSGGVIAAAASPAPASASCFTSAATPICAPWATAIGTGRHRGGAGREARMGEEVSQTSTGRAGPRATRE